MTIATSTESSTSGTSLDSDMFSVSGDSDDASVLVTGTLQLPVVIRAAFRLCEVFLNAYGSGTSSSSAAEFALPSSSAAGSNPAEASAGLYASMSKGKSRKRSERPDDSDDEDSSLPPKKKIREEAEKHFACPFSKYEPARHQACLKLRLKRTRDVKQHIHRKHCPEFYCNRCKHVFGTETELNEHSLAGGASLSCVPSSLLEGISHRQRYLLSKKSRKDATEAEQWFDVWIVIFPTRPRPISPYLDTEVDKLLTSMREYCHENQEAVLLEPVLSAAMDLLLDRCFANQSLNAASPAQNSYSGSTSQSDKPPSGRTPAGSSQPGADSGIGMDSRLRPSMPPAPWFNISSHQHATTQPTIAAQPSLRVSTEQTLSNVSPFRTAGVQPQDGDFSGDVKQIFSDFTGFDTTVDLGEQDWNLEWESLLDGDGS
ncbi:hypothetical protein CTRI78_v008561 [Colletotrichum trifolii]|uniref:C2H2-type domain-containing protein n=1 Tax=Colletotrichum trifolii TaxID=5466 RepID=A0A4R8R033_COLTR|nr:hypothetical protein CTRI78_v008561 [Colletotrichum trifolii]